MQLARHLDRHPKTAVSNLLKYFSLFLGCFLAVVPLLVVLLASL